MNDPTSPGAVLAGKYRVERVLGQGGMGVVVEARHMVLDERVALKFLLSEFAQHPDASARFLREARAAVKIKSEHVARVSDVGTLETGAPYMVMEYLDGSDLGRVLVEEGPLSIPDAVDYVIQGCEAIAEAHGHGIVHRDLKPANLFLSKRPNGLPIVKVLDFGISKTVESAVDNLTGTTSSMGSALYMSPEQMQQTRGVDSRTDIYALGISLYELLAGRQPFRADTLPALCAEVFTGTPTPIRTLRADVPEALAAAMEKAYARDRALRHQTIADFVVALAPFAPPRSQGTIESVARMARVDPPVAGARRPPRVQGGTPLVPSPLQQGGTQLMKTLPRHVAGPPAPVPVAAGSPAAPAAPPPAAGPPQTATPAIAAEDAQPALPMRRDGAIIAALTGAVVVLGIVAVVALRSPASTPHPSAAPTPAADPAPGATSTALSGASPVLVGGDPAVAMGAPPPNPRPATGVGAAPAPAPEPTAPANAVTAAAPEGAALAPSAAPIATGAPAATAVVAAPAKPAGGQPSKPRPAAPMTPPAAGKPDVGSPAKPPTGGKPDVGF